MPLYVGEHGLVRDALLGDWQAFARIMRRHNQRLYRLAVSVLGDAGEAEDVLQESYVRAFYKLSSFAGKASLGAWLARIVRNEAIDRLRARTLRANAVTIEADLPLLPDGEASDVILQCGTLSADPETNMAREDLRAILERTICSLPDSFRTVFVLREVEGLSIQETAEYLGIPPATVKTRDHRARLLLRERLSAQVDAATREAFRFLGERCDAIVERVLTRLRN